MSHPSFAFPTAPLRLAVAQAQPVQGDIDANVAKAVELIETAAADGARLVMLPEKFLSGYEPDLIGSDPRRYAVGTGDARLAPIAEACRRHAIAAIVGAASYDDDGLYISSLVFGRNGELAARYHKQRLFSGEKALFKPGAAGCALELGGWRLGLGVCYDSGFPEHARAAALAGCHAYLVSALFSVGNGYHESRVWLPARALDNTLYVLLSNHVGTTGGWNACGGSAIWGPYGNLLAEAPADAPAVVAVDLQPEVLAEVRKRETMLADLPVAEMAPFVSYCLD